MNRCAILCFLLLLPSVTWAQTAGQIGRMGFGGRGIAVGNALAGDASGFASPFYNPALAPYIPNQSLGLSAALMTHDRQIQFVELRTPLRPLAGIAAGLVHTGVRQIDQRNSSGYHTGMGSTNEYAFFAAFGVRIGSRASIGIGLQMFRNDLHEDLSATQAFGLDIGIGMHVHPSVHVGVVVDDLLARYDWDALSDEGQGVLDKFPTRLRAGVSWVLLDNKLLLLGEYESSFSARSISNPMVIFSGNVPRQIFQSREFTLHRSHFKLGAEYTLIPSLVLRAGMARLEEFSNGGPRPSSGFMIQQSLGLLITQVAYTFVLEPYAIGGMHMIALRFYL